MDLDTELDEIEHQPSGFGTACQGRYFADSEERALYQDDGRFFGVGRG